VKIRNILAPAGIAVAQSSQMLTVYAAQCPVDYAGSEFFEECFATPWADFRLDVRHNATTVDPFIGTDREGFASFNISEFPPGRVTISTGHSKGSRTVYRVPVAVCTAGGDGLEVTLPETRSTGAVIYVEVLTESDVRCDLYVVPLSLAAVTGGTDAGDELSETTTLPGTGAGPAPSGGDGVLFFGTGLLLLCCARRLWRVRSHLW
jgi:hypothetical protein